MRDLHENSRNSDQTEFREEQEKELLKESFKNRLPASAQLSRTGDPLHC